MPYDNRNISSIDKTSNSTTGKKPHLTKSQQKPLTKMTLKNKTSFIQKGKGTGKFAIKKRSAANMFSRNESTEEKKIDWKNSTESADNKCSNDMDYDDPITMLRKEIHDWRINEILTARTEERFIGTPSEQCTYSYVASGETTKRQQSPNNPPKSCRTCVDFPAAKNNRPLKTDDWLPPPYRVATPSVSYAWRKSARIRFVALKQRGKRAWRNSRSRVSRDSFGEVAMNNQ